MVKWTIVIVALGLFLRLYMLSVIPKGIYVDDAAIGYNAYSILKTGRDEYGQIMPLFLKSWNAFTPALVVYFAVVPVKLFGLNVFALRLTPVLLGTMTIFVVGYIAGRRWYLPALLLMAINPSHILFSRSFFEATLSILLFALAIALHRKKALLAFIFLALSSYAYHTTRLLAYPLLGYWILEAYQKRKFNKYLIIGLSVFILSQIPQLFFSISTGSSQNLASKSWLGPMMQTKNWPIAVAKEFSAQYLTYFSPRSLFHLPDPDPQRSLPGVSEFYTWMLIPYIFGLTQLVKHWHKNKTLIFLLLIFPIPASLAKDPFSTLRASIGLIPLTVVIAVGIGMFRSKYKSFILILLFGLSLATLFRSLFILLPNERASQWTYGYQQVFDLALKSSIPAVVDTDKPVYILYLFYEAIDPSKVQALAKKSYNYYAFSEWQNYYHDEHVDFRSLVWKKDIYQSQLLIGSPLLISESQAQEQFLSKKFAIASLVVYQTHPELKCAAVKDEAMCP